MTTHASRTSLLIAVCTNEINSDVRHPFCPQFLADPFSTLVDAFPHLGIDRRSFESVVDHDLVIRFFQRAGFSSVDAHATILE